MKIAALMSLSRGHYLNTFVIVVVKGRVEGYPLIQTSAEKLKRTGSYICWQLFFNLIGEAS